MFRAANQNYDSLSQLTAMEVGQFESTQLIKRTFPIYEDVYGRRVIHLRERYPCFDSWDFMYENRFHHWFFVRHEKGLALVYYDDGRDEYEITDAYSNDLAGFRVNPDIRERLKDSGLMN